MFFGRLGGFLAAFWPSGPRIRTQEFKKPLTASGKTIRSTVFWSTVFFPPQIAPPAAKNRAGGALRAPPAPVFAAHTAIWGGKTVDQKKSLPTLFPDQACSLLLEIWNLCLQTELLRRNAPQRGGSAKRRPPLCRVSIANSSGCKQKIKNLRYNKYACQYAPRRLPASARSPLRGCDPFAESLALFQ